MISTRDQARRYFLQPQVGIPTAPINTNSAWRGDRLLADTEQWSYQLSTADIAELDAALAASAHLPLDALTPSVFELPTLSATAKSWAVQVHAGLGFVRVRGFPVARWGEDQASRAYWALGQYLGEPGAQNPQGELLGHVKDYGEQSDTPEVRLYRTAADILYHCDAADMVGLLCLQPARVGGASRIVSSVTLFNQLFDRAPELVPTLFEPFLIDARGEQAPGADPWNAITPCAFSGERLHTFFHSDYLRSMARHASAPKRSPAQQRLVELYEELGNEPGVFLDMEFQAGDLQLLSNHTVLHARTAYEDWVEPARRRHLLRLWLTADYP